MKEWLSFVFLVLAVTQAPGSGAPESPKWKLSCTGGKTVQGGVDRWSPWSQCPNGYVVTGLQRVDLLGDHQKPSTHVNDFLCDDRGCRAWCIGAECTVEARCCTVLLENLK